MRGAIPISLAGETHFRLEGGVVIRGVESSLKVLDRAVAQGVCFCRRRA